MALLDDLKSGINQQADVQRKRVAQTEGTQLQGQKDALARRAAQLGGGPSGAFVKQEQIAGDKSAERVQSANEGIDAQANAQMNELRKTQQAQEYGTSERVAGQEFTSGESAMARRYATGEREASQAFGSGERQASQEFASGERQAGQQFSAEQMNTQIKAQAEQIDKQLKAAADQQAVGIQAQVEAGKISSAQAAAQLAEVHDQYQKDLEQSVKNNYVTAILSAKNSGLDPAVIGELLQKLGVSFDATGTPKVAAVDQAGVTYTSVPDNVLYTG